MKNYVKPSIELNKFDTEEILTTSNPAGLSKEAQSIVETYNGTATNKVDLDKAYNQEFQW